MTAGATRVNDDEGIWFVGMILSLSAASRRTNESRGLVCQKWAHFLSLDSQDERALSLVDEVAHARNQPKPARLPPEPRRERVHLRLFP